MYMVRKFIGFLSMTAMLLFSGCFANQAENADTAASTSEHISQAETGIKEERRESIMKLSIDKTNVPVTWENNSSTEALKELLPLTISMSMYGGFEQVGSIGQSIPANDKQTTTNYGDIVLYSGNKIVIFYGSNSWAYTRLGHINLSQQEMSDLLSHGDVTITFTKE